MGARWVKLGMVGKANGLKGAFFVSGRYDPIGDGVKTISFGPDPDRSPIYRLAWARMQGDRPILCCRELTSRDAIDVFKGQFIWAPRREIPIDDQNEYLWADLQGKQVLDAMGVVVGMIEGVTNFGATDILEIRGERGRLAIPLVSTYVDMSFQPDDATISLVVEAATFEEAWEDS